MADLGEHFAYLEAEYAAARAAPLSSRKARLVAALIDALADRLFAAGPQAADAGDILEFRAGLAATSPALRLVFDLCADRPGGPRFVTEAVTIPIAEYGKLSVEDFMVSLYNQHSVQRLLIAEGEARHDAHKVLGAAIATLRQRIPSDREA